MQLVGTCCPFRSDLKILKALYKRSSLIKKLTSMFVRSQLLVILLDKLLYASKRIIFDNINWMDSALC